MTEQIDIADLPDDVRDGNAADSDFIDRNMDDPIVGADLPDTGSDGADDPVNENMPDEEDE